MISAFGIYQWEGIPQRLPPDAQKFLSYADSNPRHPGVESVELIRQGAVPEFGVKEGPANVLVWGDSHAASLMVTIEAVCQDLGVRGYEITHASTAPLLDFYLPYSSHSRFGLAEKAPAYNRAVVDFAIENDISLVIIAAFWSPYTRQDDFEEALMKTLQTLVEAGISVAIVEDIAFQYSYVPGSLAQAVWEGKDVDKIGVKHEQYTSKNEKAKLAFARGAQRKNVNVYDPAPFFVTAAGFWPAQVDGVSHYRDRHHLSEPGSLKLKPLIRQIFEDAALPTASADRPDYQ